jgi:hypothetical protein
MGAERKSSEEGALPTRSPALYAASNEFARSFSIFLAPLDVLAEIAGVSIRIRESPIHGDAANETHSARSVDLIGVSVRRCNLTCAVFEDGRTPVWLAILAARTLHYCPLDCGVAQKYQSLYDARSDIYCRRDFVVATGHSACWRAMLGPQRGAVVGRGRAGKKPRQRLFGDTSPQYPDWRQSARRLVDILITGLAADQVDRSQCGVLGVGHRSVL